MLTAPFKPLLVPGQLAPLVVLLNQWGTLTNIATLCAEKPVLMTFIEGSHHGPSLDFCRQWQVNASAWDRLNDGQGVHRVVVSADNWDRLYAMTQREGLTYPVLFDPFAKTALKYRSVWWKGFLTRSSWVLLALNAHHDLVILEAKRGRPSIDQIAAVGPLSSRAANKN
jgi:peroxiredoxin